MDICCIAKMLSEMDLCRVTLRLGLTPPQMKVLLGILRDETAERIAATLGREPSTVKSHIQTLRENHNVGSRAGIVTLVLGTLIDEMQQDIDRLKAEVETLRGEGEREREAAE